MAALFITGGFPTAAPDAFLGSESEPEPGPQPDPERPTGAAYRRKYKYRVGNRTIYGTPKGIATVLRTLAQQHAEEDAKVARAVVRKVKAKAAAPVPFLQAVPSEVAVQLAQDADAAKQAQETYRAAYEQAYAAAMAQVAARRAREQDDGEAFFLLM